MVCPCVTPGTIYEREAHIIRAAVLALGLGLAARSVSAHGQLNFPPSTRQGLPGKTWPGALSGQGAGGYCEQPNSENKHNPLNGACMLFSQPNVKQPKISIIPGEPTLNAPQYRTNNVNVSSGPNDWTRTKPWRSPGAAPVLGSGCGVAGGGIMWNNNGGWPPTGMKLGQDPVEVLPGPKDGPVTMWQSGEHARLQTMFWLVCVFTPAHRCCRLDADRRHGGVGESRRGLLLQAVQERGGQGDGRVYDPRQPLRAKQLSLTVVVRASGFQRTQLKFAEKDVQWLQHINGTKYQIPMTKWTSASGAEWARIPFPTCANTGGNPPGHGFTDGAKGADGIYYCPGGTEYPEPLLNGQRVGLIGFGYCNHTNAGCPTPPSPPSCPPCPCPASVHNWLTAAVLRNRHGGQVPRLQHRRPGPNP